ncbi:MAG: aryl-sulfate sulfotransferase [Prolixibacteraceae bacterium]|nr:aryl-sulfate sulfotransferase [Prolixibacteraceae bacterium]
MRIKLLLYSLIIVLVVGCNDQNKKRKVDAGVIITKVTLTPCENNILRVNATIDLKSAATVEVKYYKESDPQNVHTAKISPSSQKHLITLLMLEEKTSYKFSVKATTDKTWTSSKEYSFTTASLPSWMPEYKVTLNKLKVLPKGYIHIAQKEGAGYLVLLSYEGKIVWYEKLGIGVNVSSFDPQSGTFACIVGNNPDRIYAGSEIIVVDLYGNILMRRANTSFDNPYFHHDILRLENGNLVVINCVPKVFDLGAVGGKADQTVWGDGYTIYNPLGEPVSSWDVFGEIDPRQDPNILGIGINEANYPVVFDWVHANTISVDTDGNFLMCFKQLNQVWKIDSKNGQVLFRLGLNGNVEMDPRYITQGVHSVYRDKNGSLLFFDNGLFKRQSRALSFTVDVTAKTSTLTREIVFPEEYFSRAQGSVYMTDQDHYLFGSSVSQTMIITDTIGQIVWNCSSSHVFYRAYPIEKIEL